MGRKIPGKKHRGVKDPLEQHLKRQALLKNKINQPPANIDDQPIPKSALMLMNRKNAGISKKPRQEKQIVKKFDKKTQKRKLSMVASKTGAGVANPLNKLEKIKGESKKSFNLRINESLKNLKRDTVNVTFKDIQEIVPEKKQKKVDSENKPEYIQKAFKKKKKLAEGEVHLTKNQKKTMKEKAMKEKIKDKKEFEQKCMVKTDFVKFGEIVHEPPNLNVKPRKADGYETVSRPARKDLLLNSLFDGANRNNDHANRNNLIIRKSKHGKGQNMINLKGKLKELPKHVRSEVEATRKEAIDAYRLLKLQKNKKHDS